MAKQLPISGDSSGNFSPIKIAQTTNGTAQTVHASTDTDGEVDSVWLDLINTSAAIVRVTILKGGTTEPDNAMYVDVPPAGVATYRHRVMDGVPINGGAIIKVYAATANVVTVDGWVNRVVAQ